MVKGLFDLDINNGVEGLMRDINTVNFSTAIWILNKFYGVSLKALAEYSGINYNTIRVLVADGGSRALCDENIELAIKRLRAIYSCEKVVS